jgi:hypothetical protein
MVRYKLSETGLNKLKGFVFETGNDDFIDACISEAESIASHAFNCDNPALLTVADISREYEHVLTMPREWFEVVA